MERCPGAPVVLVGTKVDLRQDVRVVRGLRARGRCPISHGEGVWMLREIGGVGYVECQSSRLSEDARSVFELAVQAVLLKRSIERRRRGSAGLSVRTVPS